MSFTLYDYVLSGNCYKIRLFAALVGVKYESVAVNFHPGSEHRSEKMLSLSPAGTLPILVADDLVLSDTSAMLYWMARNFDKSGDWWSRDDSTLAAQILQWMGISSDLTNSIGQLRLHAMLNREIDVDSTITASKRALRLLESHLTEQTIKGSAWLVGKTPTIADIACFPYTALSPDAGLEHDPYPAIRNWLYSVRSLDNFITMPGIHAMHELREGEIDHGTKQVAIDG